MQNGAIYALNLNYKFTTLKIEAVELLTLLYSGKSNSESVALALHRVREKWRRKAAAAIQ
jgi:hypothetical protein